MMKMRAMATPNKNVGSAEKYLNLLCWKDMKSNYIGNFDIDAYQNSWRGLLIFVAA